MTTEKTGVEQRSVKFQYFAAIIANLITFSFGSGDGWFSPALPMLENNGTTPMQSGAITRDEKAWAGAILSIAAILGNLITGFLSTKIGSKTTIMLLGVPQLISWLLLIFGTEIYHLTLSRFFLGFTGGGAQTTISIYVAEIADNKIRGQLGTIFQYGRRLGIVFAFIIVSYFDYMKLAMIYVGVTILFYGSFLFMPQTPQYLLQKNRVKQAEKSLQFYKGYQDRKESMSFKSEMEQLKSFSKAFKEEPKFKFSDLIESEALKAIIQAFIISALNQLSAVYVFTTYGTVIIESSGTKVSKEIATVLLGVAQLLGVFVASQLIDRKGRRFLLLVSTAGCTVCHTTLTIFSYLHVVHCLDIEFLHFMPVLCMTSCVFFSAVGIVPLTFIYLVETFPAPLRSFGVTFGSVVLNVFAFLTILMYPTLSETIHLHGCLLIFAISCAFGLVFTLLCVKETNGKDLNVVERRNTIAANEKV